MPGKRKFEEQVAALDELRSQPEEARVSPLRKALAQRNNFLVAKAADLVREFRMAQLMPELLNAFDRFFENAEKIDPQCWAKNSLSGALAALEYQDPEVFLRGMRHIQMEPVWGGRSDTAGTLRATCALALVQCRSLTEKDLLEHLIDLFADKDKAVRAEVVRAVEQLDSPSASLLLRLRAVLGNDEAEVLGACYGGVLRIEGVRAIPWVQRFLASGDDSAAEAALAIAGTHSAEGFKVLRECVDKATDHVVALGLALGDLPDAARGGAGVSARTGSHGIARRGGGDRGCSALRAFGGSDQTPGEPGCRQCAVEARLRNPPQRVLLRS